LQALIRDKRWRNLALLAISKNRQRYNITSGNMETLAALLIEKGARLHADSAFRYCWCLVRPADALPGPQASTSCLSTAPRASTSDS
jgi:hypothetical protein